MNETVVKVTNGILREPMNCSYDKYFEGLIEFFTFRLKHYYHDGKSYVFSSEPERLYFTFKKGDDDFAYDMVEKFKDYFIIADFIVK